MTQENNPPTAYAFVPLLFRHHLWSNLHIIDACLALSDEQIDHQIPGTYGSIRATLRHLVNAEEAYLYRLSGFRAVDNPPKADSGLPIDDIKSRMQLSGEMLLDVALSISGTRLIQFGQGADIEQIPATSVLLQVIHHATEHRTQIGTIMGQLGVEPPEISSWSYYDEVIAPTQ